VDKDLESVQEARDLVEAAYQASQVFRAASQAQVDAIVAAMAAVAEAHAERLGRLAVEETGYGKPEDKTLKNLFAAHRVHQAIRPLRTVGVIAEDAAAGVVEFATPVGVVAAVLPVTNPTSTAIYKVLIAVKAGNAIVVSPHPAALRCICETVSVLRRAALEAGAPEGLIGCFTRPSLAGTQELMRHRRTGVILATGGTGIVRAAYSSGKPAYGVGPGNVPAFIDRSADVAAAVGHVLAGKSFDWGTICSSEQAIVAEEALRAPVTEELRRQGAHFLNDQEAAQLGATLIVPATFTVNPKCVGQSPQRLGELAGFPVPSGARALVAELRGMGKEYPLSAEKLSPALALFFVPDREAAFTLCSNLLHFGGLGHTCVIHATDDAVIREYGRRMPAFRVVVNSPAPQGSIGETTNLFPAMTLGCGAVGGNITSDNIGPRHLFNTKRLAYPRREATAAVAAAAGAAATRASRPSETTAQPSRPSPSHPSPTSSPFGEPQAGQPSRLSGPLAPPAQTPAAAPSQAFTSSAPASAGSVSELVDRFLRGKQPVAAPGTPAQPSRLSEPAAVGWPSQLSEPASQPSRLSEPAAVGWPSRLSDSTPPPSTPLGPTSRPPVSPPPAAPPQPAAFVCEADVRLAIKDGRKILIGPKTIVTPAARDLANEHKAFAD
jgi:acetaldehyde dehydrogenase (acetylating)